jgi:hypothetical protein
MPVDPNPRTSMPARTRAVVPCEAAKPFDFPDDIGFLLVVFNNSEMGFRYCGDLARPQDSASVSQDHVRVHALAVI